MNKFKRAIELLFSAVLSITLSLCVSMDSFAYYCTPECYQVCGKTEFAGQCSLDMSCPDACTGHHASPCHIVFAEATCTQSGKIQTQICDAVSQLGICHARDEFTYPAALGHDYCAWYYISDTQHERDCSRNCGEPGEYDIEDHTYDSKYPIAYEDIGDTHITTYRHDCYKCGYYEIWTEIEEHVYNPWKINEEDEYTATRSCKYCGHQENEWIGIELDPLDDWTTENATVEGLSRFWNDCDISTPQSVVTEKIISTNKVDTVTKTVSTTNEYTENREGCYKYEYTYTDKSVHEMHITIGDLLIDHSAPQLSIKVTCGGTDNNGTRYTDNIEYTQNVTTHGSSEGITFAETKWVNTAPTIYASATDYYKDTVIDGSGVHSVIIYDDEGHVVGAGAKNASYSLTAADEGTHVYTIVATDVLCRKAYTFTPIDWSDSAAYEKIKAENALFTEKAKSVYNATGANASSKYRLSDWLSDFNYDINHVTVTQIVTHYDCTAPVIVGPEDETGINIIEAYYCDSRTVYAGKNIISELINDFYTNSLNYANDSSDIKSIVFEGYDKSDNRTTIASLVRKDVDAWLITQSTDFIEYGSGYTLASASRSYSTSQLLPIEEDDTHITVTRPTSSGLYMRLNTDPRFDTVDEKYDPVTDDMINELQHNYEYYAIRVTDIAGNTAVKKIVPEYAELRTFHTTIDPSSYKDPDTGLKR